MLRMCRRHEETGPSVKYRKDNLAFLAGAPSEARHARTLPALHDVGAHSFRSLRCRLRSPIIRLTVHETLSAHDQAVRAFELGDYTQVIEIARRRPSDVWLCMLGARAHWNQSGPVDAERACAHALRKHGLSAELHYMHAIALVECGRLDDALRAVRRSLYLDRSLTVAQFAHASILEQLHNLDGARRAYRSTYNACSSRPPNEEVPLGDGIVAQRLADAAARALEQLDSGPTGSIR